MTESELQQECLAWLPDVGWQPLHGPNIAPDGATPERDNYREVLLLAASRQFRRLLVSARSAGCRGGTGDGASACAGRHLDLNRSGHA